MNVTILWVWLVSFLIIFSGVQAVAATTPEQNLNQTSTEVLVSTLENSINELKQVVDKLKTTILTQRLEISKQKGMLDVILQRTGSSNDPSYTALSTGIGILFAAIIAGLFALRNQNEQRVQERQLKAIEIIMESRSGYQAAIRKKNLSIFLDETSLKHLENISSVENISSEFSGPEYTDLQFGLAGAMAEKAKKPEEVLKIWKSVFKEKKVIQRVTFPDLVENNAVQQSKST